MANTVNDVMNVIASPDYGIKNIAGTNQEILAILEGYNNSPNNIHAIVNDIKNLLQTLVVTSTEIKPVEIDDKTAKIKQKHIETIIDEAKNIRTALSTLLKEITKQGTKMSPTINNAKLSDKASEKVAAAMIKDIEKQKNGGGMAGLIDVFNKLKDISLKDLLLGKPKIKLIGDIFKKAQEDLKIDKKELNSIIKLINAAPEIVNSLSKVGLNLWSISKFKIVEKLSELLIGKKDSLLLLSQTLTEHGKTFTKASKAAKNIKEMSSSLNVAMMELVLANIWSKFAGSAASNLVELVDKLIPLSNKLIKNNKNTEKAAKAAKNITTLVGNLLVTSIFLTLTLVTTPFAILGAILLNVMIGSITNIIDKLANTKNVSKATTTALAFTAITGLMLLSTYFLVEIAKNGLDAILGSIVIFGIVVINTLTFKLLGEDPETLLKGIGVMALMSLSLLLFGVALGKIAEATKDVTWKQFGMIAALTGLFAAVIGVMGIEPIAAAIAIGSGVMILMSISLLVFGAALNKISQATKDFTWEQLGMVAASIGLFGTTIGVIGIPPIAAVIAIGSVALLGMSGSLLTYATALGKINKASENLTLKQVEVVTKSMEEFAEGISDMALRSIPIALGAAVLDDMGVALYKYVKSLKLIKDMGEVPLKAVNDTITAMDTIGTFFTKNALKGKAVKNAKKYNKIMLPFISTSIQLAKLKEIGAVPLSLVYQTLNAMSAIANYYTENPIDNDAIDQAENYKDMMKPFGNTLKYLAKLKELGDIPLGLVYQTLNAMSAIGDYYLNNPIKNKVINQAEKYEDMMKPFGNTIKYLVKLKEMGGIPLGMVYQTLNAMSAIGDYYLNNPIKEKAINQAKRYKQMLKPFGDIVESLTKLKNMGGIPLGIVYQTLNAMTAIGEYYINNPLDKDTIKQAKNYKKMLEPFGDTILNLNKLKEMGNIPSNAVESVVTAMFQISWFYKNVYITEDIEAKGQIVKDAVINFTDIVGEIQDKFANIKAVDTESITSIVKVCHAIINYYNFTLFFVKEEKIKTMNSAILSFANNVGEIKTKLGNFTESDCNGINFAMKGVGQILTFLKEDTLGPLERFRAKRNIVLLQDLSNAMTGINGMNSSNISSVGGALSSALQGVNTVNLDQVTAVTNMFNAFNNINKSENLINKFTESVDNFTEACNNLLNAMGLNTDAINNMDNGGMGGSLMGNMGGGMNSVIETTTAEDGSETKGIRISNVEEIARNIADRINGSMSIDIPDTQIQLMINGSGGNEWILTRY